MILCIPSDMDSATLLFHLRILLWEEREDSLAVSVSVKNTGSRKGTEIVQLYIRDVTASIVRPVKELKDFCRVELEPGEERKVEFILPKQKMGFYNNEGEYCLEDGEFKIYVGGNARECMGGKYGKSFILT